MAASARASARCTDSVRAFRKNEGLTRRTRETTCGSLVLRVGSIGLAECTGRRRPPPRARGRGTRTTLPRHAARPDARLLCQRKITLSLNGQVVSSQAPVRPEAGIGQSISSASDRNR